MNNYIDTNKYINNIYNIFDILNNTKIQSKYRKIKKNVYSFILNDLEYTVYLYKRKVYYADIFVKTYKTQQITKIVVESKKQFRESFFYFYAVIVLMKKNKFFREIYKFYLNNKSKTEEPKTEEPKTEEPKTEENNRG